MASALESGFLSHTPNARTNPPPEDLGIVVEEVVEGLKIVLGTLANDPPDSLSDPAHIRHSRDLEEATAIFVRFLDELPQVNWQPVLEVGPQSIRIHRLGKLLNGEYALFTGQAELLSGNSYPINYCQSHRAPHDAPSIDVMPGFPHAKQIYIGYAPPDINDMSGYAVSLNQFLDLTKNSALRLNAIKLGSASDALASAPAG